MGLLNPESSEIWAICLHDSRGVPRPWDFSSGSSLIFLKIWEEHVLTSQIEE